MAEIKGILEARFQTETKGIKTAYKKFVYWYMATLPEVVIVKYDDKWYRDTAIVAAIKVVEAAKLMNKCVDYIDK